MPLSLVLLALICAVEASAKGDRSRSLGTSARGHAPTDHDNGNGRSHDGGKGDKEKDGEDDSAVTLWDVAELDELETVDDALAAVAQNLALTDESATLRVLVFGDAADTPYADVRRELDANAASVRVPVHALYELATQTGVTYMALDIPVRHTSDSGALPPLANFALVDWAPYAWSRGAIGKRVGVAVIDSGVGNAALFGERLIRVDLDADATGDLYGHGTFVAGILAGRTADGAYSGIAPGARVFDVNVSQDDGVYTSDVIAGLEWVRANHRRLGIRVLNLSLAETVPSSHTSSPLDAAVERLWHAGVVVVVAAGNLGPGSAVYAPANDPYVITVGALDQGVFVGAADDAVAAFSASGPTLDGFAKPDVLAPGRRVASMLPMDSALSLEAPAANVLGGGFFSMSGTSFAAPQIAGAAAILLSRHPRWTPDQVKWVLTTTARPVHGSSVGTLDLRRALMTRGRPGAANRGLPSMRQYRFTPDGVFASGSWSGNTWNGNTWNGNTWNGNTWNASSWSGNTWTAAPVDPFAP
jgi:serine protease AprX